MGELKEYLDLLQEVRSDPALAAMLAAYESDSEQLSLLLSDPDYDAAEAIRLTNDCEYLCSMIESNPLYQRYRKAKETVACSMQTRAAHFSGCNCAVCQSRNCNRKPYKENE